MGKGSWRRKRTCGEAEEQLRFDLAFGRITKEEYNVAMEGLGKQGYGEEHASAPTVRTLNLGGLQKVID